MSRDYGCIADRFWNLPSKGEEEAKREKYFMDDIIQKAHLDREISMYLNGVKTVFDGGAGVGRFTIPLAQQGFKVTHFDISQSMIKKAKELAEKAGVANNIEFVEGRLTDLSSYNNEQFDLVLSFDAPVSYTYPQHQQVLQDLVRIARKSVIISVSSRFGYFPYFFNPAQKIQYIVDKTDPDPSVQWYIQNSNENFQLWNPEFCSYDRFLETGLMDDPDRIYDEMEKGHCPWPVNYCFTPDELETILKEAGLKNIRFSGPGALARSIPQAILKKLLFTPEYKEQFLDQCYRFDSQLWVCGLGKDNLVVSGTKV